MKSPRRPGDPPVVAPDLADPDQWHELITRVKPAAMVVVIGSVMSQRLRDHCTAEDIWQDTLTHAWRDREQHTWHGIAAFRAWLFEIAKNRIREAARRLGTQKRGAGQAPVPLAAATPGSSADLPGHPADTVTPSREYARHERRDAVTAAVAGLPEDVREVVRLHLLEELTMEAIAARLGLGVSAAWRRFRKGSALLARTLAERAPGDSGSVW